MGATGRPQLVTFSLNAGITVHEPILHRDDDMFSIGMGYAKVSNRASSLDRATPWWQLQYDVQYVFNDVFNPGGGLAKPNSSSKRVGNEVVLGLRTNTLF